MICLVFVFGYFVLRENFIGLLGVGVLVILWLV